MVSSVDSHVKEFSLMNYGTGEYWRATAALSLGSFLVFAIVYLTQPLLPLFVVEFGLSEFMSSLSLSVVVFCISVALLIYGPVSDAVGRKPIMVWCMAGGVVSTVLTATSAITRFSSSCAPYRACFLQGFRLWRWPI